MGRLAVLSIMNIQGRIKYGALLSIAVVLRPAVHSVIMGAEVLQYVKLGATHTKHLLLTWASAPRAIL